MYGLNGIDIWRWIDYARFIKLNNYKLPFKIPGYLDPKPFNYPPLFLYILSLFPLKIIEKAPYLLSYIFFILEIFVIIYFNHSYNLLPVFIIFILAYDKMNYFSTRSLASLIMALLYYSYITFSDQPHILFPITFILFYILFFSHRHSLQYVFLFILVRQLFFHDFTLIFISFLGSFAFALLFSSAYRRVFLNHYSILSFYFEKINISTDYKLIKPFNFDYKRFINNLLIAKILVFVIFVCYISTRESISLINAQNLFNFALIFTFFYATIKHFKIFSFLGEPERDFDYILFIISYYIYSLSSNTQYLLLCFSIIIFISRILYNKFNKKNIYRNIIDYNAIETKIKSIVGINHFSFFSYPALFDDFVKYKFNNSKVFFHDNGLSLKYAKIKYIPDFIPVILPDLYLELICLEHDIDLFIINKKFSCLITPKINQIYVQDFYNDDDNLIIYKKTKIH